MKRAVWHQAWWTPAQPRPSPNHGERPAGTLPWLVVLHSISLPPGVYRGDAIERLFTNRLDCRTHPFFEQLEGLQVSAHFVIRRSGRVQQYVAATAAPGMPGDRRGAVSRTATTTRSASSSRAWRVSASMRASTRHWPGCCAAWPGVTPCAKWSTRAHCAGAQARPGPGFDWPRLVHLLGWSSRRFAPWCAAATGDFPRA